MKQRGGRLTVGALLVLAALAVGCQRATTHLQTLTIRAPRSVEYRVQSFPPASRWVSTCDGFTFICYTKI